MRLRIALMAVTVAAGSIGTLELVIHQGGGLRGTAARVTLTCGPDGGTHPHPAEACAALRTARGDLTKLGGQRAAMCPMIYKPVTAYASGTWRHRKVAYRKTFGNACELHTSGDPVFAFG